MSDWTALEHRRPFRWQPYKGERHAVPHGLRSGCQGTTACDRPVRVPTEPPTKTEGLWPECQLCDDAWRAVEGLAPRPAFARRGDMASPQASRQRGGVR